MATSTTSSTILAGATGLVGSACLRLLLADPVFGRITVLTRRPLPAALREPDTAGRLDERMVDFAELEALPDGVRWIVCALGTTIRKAGSRARFREVDYDYPLRLAELGLAQGARHFLLVSALGANSRSRFFYNRVKGELEQALLALPYRSITILRPSLLVGPRSEFRPAEALGQRLGFLFPASARPVAASAVAAALVSAAREDRPGQSIIPSAEIRARFG